MKIILLFILLVTLFSCTKDPEPFIEEPTDANSGFTISSPPFTISEPGVKFYKNLEYGSSERNTFDLFLPESENPTGIVVFIHGGGFVTGDKSFAYSSPQYKNIINELLSKDIAFASINYRLLESGEEVGALKSIKDSKKALQYIRFQAEKYNVRKNDVVLMGGSAGAGTSLWLALRDEMGNSAMYSNWKGESTRVKGVVAIQAQGSYDLLQWPNTVFQEYQSQGFSFETVKTLLTEQVINQFYGINDLNKLNSPEIQQDRNELDFLSQLSSDDPELYLENVSIDYTYPNNSNTLLHHPLHSKILMEKASSVNVPTRVYLPTMNIDTRNGESIVDFVVRKFNE